MDFHTCFACDGCMFVISGPLVGYFWPQRLLCELSFKEKLSRERALFWVLSVAFPR